MPNVNATVYSRREFILKAGGGALALYLPGGCLGQINEALTGGVSTRGRLGVHPTKEITPNDEFYITSYNGVPKVRIKDWSLRIDGLVEQPLDINFEDLSTFPSVSKIVTLICIGNSIGGGLIGNAEWTGVPLQSLLEEAKVTSGAVDVVLYGGEGYSDSFPIEKALNEDTVLVHTMNGETLPAHHGFPLRAIVPGIYGMKNVKWLNRVEVVDNDYKGYWERKGWSDTALVKLMSRIDAPVDQGRTRRSPYNIAGIAYGGIHGVSKVEVSTDGGRRWDEAEMKEPLSRFAWTLWNYPWEPTSRGKHEISVRATDNEGIVQKKGSLFSRRGFPAGADGIHSVTVYVDSL